jgi:Protein of unknown function (DUF2505)
MKVTIEDVFEGIGCSDYVELYFDEAFNESIGRALHMGRRLLRLDRGPERIVRHVCYEPNHDPESPAHQAFGTSRASFVEELDYDVRTRRGTWRTIPNLWADRVHNAGVIELADLAGGTRRVVRGEVKVKLFGFGRLVEKMIVAEIENSYAATARLTREWIAKR